LARRAFRVLPPFLAFRIFHRWFQDLNGCGEAFDEPAFYGSARIRSTMTSVEDSYFALFGTMNFKGLALARFFLRHGDVVFEIGANVGTETLALAALVGRGGRVVAAEADPDNARELIARVNANALGQVSVVDRAVSDAVTPMSIVRIAGKGGQSYVRKGGGHAAVESVTLDQLAATHGAPRFVFADIEGGEYRAFLGGACMLEQSRPVVFSEVSNVLLARAGTSVDALLELMTAYRYVAFDTDRRTLPRVDRVGDADVFADWLFLPAERLREITALRRYLLWARVAPRIPLLSPLR
jgi:FkbM family methyltransferase